MFILGLRKRLRCFLSLKNFLCFVLVGRMAFQWIFCADGLYRKLTLSSMRTKELVERKERKEIRSFDLTKNIIKPGMGRRGMGNKGLFSEL